MSGRLNGKVAIVTGGGQGIGAAISRRFAEEGARVVIAQRTVTVGEGHAEALRAAGHEVRFVRADISSRKSIVELVARAVDLYGPPTVLVNNAAIDVFADPLKVTEEQWRRCFTVDLDGAWWLTREVLPHMLESGGGSIVNISSNHAFRIIPGAFPYPVVKHAITGLTRALAVEYAARHIRVNAICPAYIETQGTSDYWATFADPLAERRRAESIHPTGRIGQPDEVAWPAVFLASDEASFVTGVSLMVDGGSSVVLNGHGNPFVEGVGPSGVTPGLDMRG
jgi:NAD(P)-dependent dehydrogenase (short-subunit alcohol dehydrogenase family)